jgi:hypothetical protein
VYSTGEEAVPVRHSHAATESKQFIYVFGGVSLEDEKLNDIWTFDTEKRKWYRPLLPVTIEKRAKHTAHLCASKIFLFNGEKQEICNELLICQHPGTGTRCTLSSDCVQNNWSLAKVTSSSAMTMRRRRRKMTSPSSANPST